tara:strand:+ start:161 stop:550 length:390 start_codon:yes stop_codon:yes gene_type:complete
MFSLKVLGLDKLNKKLNSKNTLGKPLSEQIGLTTAQLEAGVKKATPVVTGRLRGSIFSEINPHKSVVGTNVFYAPFVEFGTSRMDARYVVSGNERVIGDIGPFVFAANQLKMQGVEVALGKKVEKIWGK